MNLTGCMATAALTDAEVRRLKALPNSEHAVTTVPRACEFEKHDAEVLHGHLVQSQFDGEKSVSWWLRWDDAGFREITKEPTCEKLREEDGLCLLVVKHPGRCNDGRAEEGGGEWTLVFDPDEEEGFPAWELRQGDSVLYDEDTLSRDQITEALAWAVETLREGEELTVTGWTEGPGRWTAHVADGEGE